MYLLLLQHLLKWHILDAMHCEKSGHLEENKWALQKQHTICMEFCSQILLPCFINEGIFIYATQCNLFCVCNLGVFFPLVLLGMDWNWLAPMNWVLNFRGSQKKLGVDKKGHLEENKCALQKQHTICMKICCQILLPCFVNKRVW